MKKKFGSVILLLLLIAKTPVFAQNNQIGLNWQKCLGGSGNDVLQELITLPTGDVMVLDTTTSNNGDVTGNHGAEDIWVVRVNASSSILWQRCIGGSAKDSAVNMLITSDGGVLISGITFSNDGDATGNHGQRDALVARLDANGNLLWTRCLGGSANEILIRMAAVGASGFTLFGETTSNNGDVSGNHGGTDLWVIHLNGAGATGWQRCYGGSLNETASDFRYLPQHNAYLLLGKPGSVNGDLTTSHKDRVAWLMKTDLTGTITAQAVGGFANPFSVANGNKYAVGGFVQDNSLYGFTYTEEVNFGIGFSSSRMHAIAFLCRFNPATMPGFTDYYNAGLNIKLNEQPSEYTNETDGSKGIVGLKGRTGGGFLMLEDYEGCYFMDNYGWAFAMNAAKSGLTTGRFNAAGYRPDGITKVRAVCNNTFYPNQVTRGNYFSGDAYMPDENQFVSGGRTTDLDRNPNYGGSHDAYLARGSSASFFGGSGNEGFTRLARIDNINFYAGGFTTSNNGQVSGNHGGDEIWLVNARLRNNTIKGTAYVDLNGNGTKDATEPWATGYMVSSRNNFIDVQSGLQQGKFINQVGTGAFTSSLMNLPAYFTAVPPSINTNFSGLDNTDSIGFALKPAQNFNDLAVDFIAQNVARPGFTTSYRIIYKNYGTQAANGVTLSFVKDNRLTLLSSSLGGYTTIGDTLRWSLGNLNFMQEGIIDLNLQVAAPPVVNIGDTLRSKIMIDPMNGDISPSNNTMALNQRVQGSFDPNDKLENHAGSIRRVKALAGEELVYTIRFQNTGTDTAFNVYIRDTLPTSLDASSLRVISASHAYTVESSGFMGFGYQRVLTFRFNNILLPDSGTNAAASNGFISFALKTVNSITVGNQVLNSASIYFDFNASVSTNTVKTVIDGVPKPQVFVENGFCYNAGLQSGKVLNPGSYAVSVSLDNIPLVYNQADSTFSFNVTGLATNIPHPLKVVFTYDPNEKDSLIILINVSVPPLATIFLGDTTLCQGAAPLLLLGSVDRWRIMYPSGASLCQGVCYFNPQLAGPGTHLVIGETDSHFPCYTTTYDTLRITVGNLAPPVIYNNDTTVCVLSSPIALSSNIPAIWSGAGVAGNTFTPSIAGPGTHKIIATKTNGVCPDSKDTLTVTVDDFVQAVIATPNQTVCISVPPIALQANTNVSWVGTGVSGSTFNPSVAGVGLHQIIAIKTNGTCPDSKDTLTITVDDFVQAVIATPNQTVCKLSAPISLQANTTVTWSGTGVTGATFNPTTSGAGLHQIIATKNNGACPETKDTLTITVDDFIQPVILNNDTTVCILGTAFNLRADMAVSWNGPGVTGSSFNPATAGAGTHLLFATRANGACPNGRDTLLVTVTPALTPDVQITASQNTLASVSAFSNLVATNAVGGGSNPLYTFAKDRNFTQVLQAESAVNTLRIVPQMLT
ncbi:MAG: DUF11 domain-containing protein, partial [Dinghuibacter sp.]|nr:DUF11 domain-containing protein [Dinghuibacter sp.]